jgi:hypothetical protein
MMWKTSPRLIHLTTGRCASGSVVTFPGSAAVLLEGAQSEPGPVADGGYFTTLRRRLDTAG